MAEERERLMSETRERLRGYPQPVVERFETLLKAAQEATAIHEYHAFWIDYRCFHQVRRVMLGFGRRFTEAGMIAEPEDVSYLTLDKLRTSAREMPDADQRARVSERKETNGEARSFIKGGTVRIDGDVIQDEKLTLKTPDLVNRILQVRKRRYARLTAAG